MMRSLSLLLLLGGGVVSACAIPQQVDLIEREQRRLRFEQADLQKNSTALRGEIDSIRETLADTRANLQQAQREVGVLKENLEEVRAQVDRQLGESVRAGDQRIRELESRLAKIDSDLKLQAALLKAREDELRLLRETLTTVQRAKPPPPPAPAPPVVARSPGPTLSPDELAKKDYEAALALMERKDYRGAIARFQDFLKKHPESDLADNAQYWIGEGHYALREFDQAILEFDAVRRKYPKGDKVPAALLKLGFAFSELGDKVDARLILQELMDRYPQSEEALKAQQKLKTLEL
ncbi:MAG: tol-pal system protein YbgF [Deltaproteobacteria bacterium]|nr:tol-pal system protein YbgF [Deltaproteobacteria bacterium]